MKKQILIQTQGIETARITNVKSISWASISFDDIKITVDAYIGLGSMAEPRKDSLIEIVTEKQVYEMTPEALIKAIDFFSENFGEYRGITSYKNRKHVIQPDLYKREKNEEEQKASKV